MKKRSYLHSYYWREDEGWHFWIHSSVGTFIPKINVFFFFLFPNCKRVWWYHLLKKAGYLFSKWNLSNSIRYEGKTCEKNTWFFGHDHLGKHTCLTSFLSLSYGHCGKREVDHFQVASHVIKVVNVKSWWFKIYLYVLIVKGLLFDIYLVAQQQLWHTCLISLEVWAWDLLCEGTLPPRA